MTAFTVMVLMWLQMPIILVTFLFWRIPSVPCVAAGITFATMYWIYQDGLHIPNVESFVIPYMGICLTLWIFVTIVSTVFFLKNKRHFI